MGVEEIGDARRAADLGRRALGLPASCPASSIQFELLRATVWGMAAPSGGVHINRILSSALPVLRLLTGRAAEREETLRAELRAALTDLEDAGDLLQLPGGYWGPATARLVEFLAGSGRLLIGGVPSSLLPLLPDALEHHGPYRHLAKPAPELAAALPKEDLASWSRRPSLPLQEWAGEVLESLDRQPYSPTSAESFEFYTPSSAQPGTPQFRRWSDNPGPKTTTMLARRMRIYGAREYRLVDVRAAHIVGACDLQGVDVRRLMYALDLAAKNPVRARRLHRDRAEWLFMSELPRAEQRTFAACGTLTIPDERPFERRWTFVRNEELALGMLRELGITLENRA
ncbi:hypothetical protein ACN6A1_27070 [Myxococcus virescens]|uniref:hypothetical protein n=1 Tax=Myxococcus virescens TaxID=83456 RepID=UPI003DA6113F